MTTEIRQPEDVTAEPHKAIWGPLEQLVGPALCAQFMYMGNAEGLSLYKHVNTRRYLNIGADGRTWKYQATGGYLPIPNFEAISYVLS